MNINKMKHILFWSEYSHDMNFEMFSNKKIRLSEFHKLALKSHEKLKNDVVLFTYQKIMNKLPTNITIRDADKIFPKKQAFRALKDGHTIAHISDAVRLYYASEVNGIVLDMDAVVLRKLPCDENVGYFGSMPAKRIGGVAPQWGIRHPPLKIHDNSWDGKELAAFPVKVSKSMRNDIQNLSKTIMQTLLNKPKNNSKSWNYVIWTLKDIMKKDRSYKVYPPIAFCPVPAWLGCGKCYSIQSPSKFNGKTLLYGYPLPNFRRILEESYIVQHFHESIFTHSNLVKNDFWLNLPNDCLVAKEAEYILGSNWRVQLMENRKQQKTTQRKRTQKRQPTKERKLVPTKE